MFKHNNISHIGQTCGDVVLGFSIFYTVRLKSTLNIISFYLVLKPFIQVLRHFKYFVHRFLFNATSTSGCGNHFIQIYFHSCQIISHAVVRIIFNSCTIQLFLHTVVFIINFSTARNTCLVRLLIARKSYYNVLVDHHFSSY